MGCAESTGELKSGTRNTWFILFTNTMIDWVSPPPPLCWRLANREKGFVIGAFVPYVVAAACDNQHYGTIWRTSLGIGVVFPSILLVLRFFLQEPEEFQKHSMKYAKPPYRLVLRFYGFRLFIVSLIWFIYDVSIHPPYP